MTGVQTCALPILPDAARCDQRDGDQHGEPPLAQSGGGEHQEQNSRDHKTDWPQREGIKDHQADQQDRLAEVVIGQPDRKSVV